MAFLSASDQAVIQSAIDLLEKGTAVEFPVSEDLIARIALLANSPTFAAFGYTSGEVYAVFRDNPVTALIEFAATCGEDVLTEAQWESMSAAAGLMFLTQAYERPFDDNVSTALAPVAESTGFLTKGGFKEAIKDKPVSTMLRWALFLGTR